MYICNSFVIDAFNSRIILSVTLFLATIFLFLRITSVEAQDVPLWYAECIELRATFSRRLKREFSYSTHYYLEEFEPEAIRDDQI